ncbi:TetR/AcrR family transcriptional regulator [Isoalcanivorax beigongshangi]|uniref:TetR/AcrR family transcriptional regulator n=1 Tax=Isoalcanivorax beigongshangi TaxID=3238810 RepID=A0ABV4AF01_9GAMM
MSPPSTTATPEQHKLLTALALAMVDHPRATLTELAKAVGVSKATLYRFCRTREQLMERLVSYGVDTLMQALREAQLDTQPPLEGIRRLAELTLQNRELSCFLIHHRHCLEIEDANQWSVILDAFFLRAQQDGFLRIDISAQALTEIWGSLAAGAIDAERRGRIPRVGLNTLLERFFLSGAAVQP